MVIRAVEATRRFILEERREGDENNCAIVRNLETSIFKEISDAATPKSVTRKLKSMLFIVLERREEALSDGIVRGLQLLKYGVS